MNRIILILSLVVFNVSFCLAEWNFYGSARVSTFYSSEDEDAGDDADTSWDLQSNARIGAKVSGDEISGGFEYGTSGGKANIRKLYGIWKFGAGELLVGQDYTPLNLFYSCQCYGDDDCLLSYGLLWNSRKPMLQLKFKGLKIAFVKPETSDLDTGGDVDVTFPKLQIRYHIDLDNFFLDIFGGIQSYKIIAEATETTPIVDDSVNSHVIGFGTGANIGALTISGSVYSAQNIRQFPLSTTGAGDAVVTASGIEDSSTLSMFAIIAFKINDKIKCEFGTGHVAHKSDVSGTKKDKTFAYYFNTCITPHDRIFIIPELGLIDYKDDSAGISEGKKTYGGIKWQINF
ncbi:hypothetical protein BVX93_01345 [bacterium B13(2017)]|nr:hypothetical protein BVX93_01345 [bacterium B13(2017)]